MYKLSEISRDSDDLSSGFHRSYANRDREKVNLARIKRIYQVKTYLKDVFGLVEHQ